MEIFFNKLTENNLTPNQYFALYLLNQKIDSKMINIQYEKRTLKSDGWISEDEKLTEKTIELLSDVDNWFLKSSLKKTKKKMGENFQENIEKYRLKFPGGSHNSRVLRTSFNNTKSAFDKFFNNYDYDWETIFKATDTYLDKQENENYKYCKNSRYFVMKENESVLADYCELVLSGDTEEIKHFSDKVT